jgi:hypothetical protein
MASRKITCLKCGKVTPTPSEDAARGLFTRYFYGKLLGSARCDYCGVALERDQEVVCLTQPADYPEWELVYVRLAEKTV